MKIDKKNYKHWIFMGKSVFAATVATIASPFLKKDKGSAVLYGHTFNGNIKSFADYCRREKKAITLYYLGDPWYLEKARGDGSLNGIGSLDMTKVMDMIKVAKCRAILTTHGLHIIHAIMKRSHTRFVDVWHGIAYKGWAHDDFKEQNQYDEVWVSSPALKEIYETKYNFPSNIVKVVGYARSDDLVNNRYVKEEIVKKYNLDGYKKYVLIAPTWKQDDKGRSIFPYGATATEFFENLNGVGRKNDSLIIFRAHLNSGDDLKPGKYKYVKIMPYSNYPITEEFLTLADVLVTDWSSIAIDYLPLNRPTIFMDVPSPFKSGFTLGPEHRFGFIASDLDNLHSALDRYVKSETAYQKENSIKIKHTTEFAYGNTADGRVSERYYDRLMQL